MLLSFSVAEIIKVSGVIAAFFTGFVMGNSKIPYKKGILDFNNTLSFITNMALFILLGLLASPKQFYKVWWQGITIFLILTFIARPISVWILTLLLISKLKKNSLLIWGGVRRSTDCFGNISCCCWA